MSTFYSARRSREQLCAEFGQTSYIRVNINLKSVLLIIMQALCFQGFSEANLTLTHRRCGVYVCGVCGVRVAGQHLCDKLRQKEFTWVKFNDAKSGNYQQTTTDRRK